MWLSVGNLVVDRPAVRRMIMHSIPKNKIVPNPNVSGNNESNSAGSLNGKDVGQKRVVEEISSDESGAEERQVPPTKKSKLKQSGV
jgi:hypothetical protein